MTESLVTITGSSYLQPILDLAERLLQRDRRKVVAGRIGSRENGYSLSIVLLVVVALESYVGRVSYLQRNLLSGGKPMPPRMTIPDYLATLKKSFRLQKSLTELFVLRDTIAHGHVWELEVSNNMIHGQVLHRANLLPGYGDYKYQAVLNKRTRRSSICGLNLVPSAVGRKEAYKAMDLAWRTLDFLARNGLIERATFTYYGRLGGKPFEFWELRHVLKKASNSA